MKFRLALALLAPLLHALAAPTKPPAAFDPFAPGISSWTDFLQASKPLRLEICVGEVDAVPAPSDPAKLITPEFLAAATRLTVAVADTDEGFAALPEKLSAVYRLKPAEAPWHSLEILVSFRADGGVSEINSKLLVCENWLVVGGMTRTEVRVLVDGAETTSIRNRVFAFRLAPAPSP